MIAEQDSTAALTFLAFPLAQAGGSATPELFGGAPSSAPGTVPAGAQGQPLPAQPSGGGQSMLLIFALPLLFIVLLSMWTSKKERKKRETLLNAVAKNDRVLTVGGIIGTVTEIKDDEIILRVDDNTKTKIAFAKTSIQQVIRSSGTPAETQDPQIETKNKGERATA